MFLTQRVVDLALKVIVFLDFARKHWRSVRFHPETIGSNQQGSDDACVGFSLPTREVVNPPSFEIENLRESQVDRVEIDCDLANANRQRR
jgi:hypothetical protein